MQRCGGAGSQGRGDAPQAIIQAFPPPPSPPPPTPLRGTPPSPTFITCPPLTDTLFPLPGPPSLQVGDSWFMSQRLRLPDGCEYEMQVSGWMGGSWTVGGGEWVAPPASSSGCRTDASMRCRWRVDGWVGGWMVGGGCLLPHQSSLTNPGGNACGLLGVRSPRPLPPSWGGEGGAPRSLSH